MPRFHQRLLVFCTLLASWLGMQAVHEFGHVCGAWLSGASVAKVVLNPLTISRTDLADNPHPLVVVWAGPVLGVFFPIILWWAASAARWRAAFLLRFFAGFCLIANGAYIGAGSFDGIGDCGEMLRHDCPIWALWLFGVLTVPAGLALWHRLGPCFGLGSTRGRVDRVDRVAVYCSLAALIALLILGLWVDGS